MKISKWEQKILTMMQNYINIVEEQEKTEQNYRDMQKLGDNIWYSVRKRCESKINGKRISRIFNEIGISFFVVANEDETYERWDFDRKVENKSYKKELLIRRHEFFKSPNCIPYYY